MFWMKSLTPWHGAMIKGWDISEEHFRNPNKLPVVDLAVLTKACPRDCAFCFTNKKEVNLTLGEIKQLIDQLAENGTYAIEFVWEWEPTLDQNFFEVIEYTSSKWIIPLVYSEVALKMSSYNPKSKDFISRLYQSWASILPKCDSLFNKELQNRVVRSKHKSTQDCYFTLRNEAIQNLINAWFNDINPDWTTRIWFDMVLSEENKWEVEKTLRYCRENNLYIMFAFPLTSGREAWKANSIIANRKKLIDLVNEIDKNEFGIERERDYNSFITWPCKEQFMIRGNWDIQVCPGNEAIIWNIRDWTIENVIKVLNLLYPFHNRATFDWNCPYRVRI